LTLLISAIPLSLISRDVNALLPEREGGGVS
jgi:hypothetical protein